MTTREDFEAMASASGMDKVGDLWCSEAGQGGTDEPTLQRFAAMVAERCAEINSEFKVPLEIDKGDWPNYLADQMRKAFPKP